VTILFRLKMRVGMFFQEKGLALYDLREVKRSDVALRSKERQTGKFVEKSLNF